jgi:3-keto-L-gulonate-6-phosphate decarboxylase
MKLQITFNSADLEQSLTIAKQVCHLADQIEVGSLLLGRYGLTAIQRFRAELPHSKLIANSKIVEFGKDSAKMNLEAGADWITVLAGANPEIIHAACTTTHDLGKKVMLDLIDAQSQGQSALEAKSLGVDALLLHQPYDNFDPTALFDQWDLVRGNTDLPIYISAKINRDTISSILDFNPDGLAIGKAITFAQDPVTEAEFFQKLLRTYPSE